MRDVVIEGRVYRQYDFQCPDCGAKLILKPSKYGVFYGCEMWQATGCKGSHSIHQDTGEPMGQPAGKEVRAARTKAHHVFDQLWKGGPINWKRAACYTWMQEKLGLTPEQAHISSFTQEQCELLIQLVTHEFESRGFKVLDELPPRPERKPRDQ